MTPEADALRRCERLLALMDEAMRMERAFDARADVIDASMRSLIRPILEDALGRLEALMTPSTGRSLQDWVRELIDLELELDAALAKRGWRVIAQDPDAPPPELTERL